MIKEQLSQFSKERQTLVQKLSQKPVPNLKNTGEEKMSEEKHISQFAKIYEYEQPATATPTQTITEVLDLNEKLITTLEQADGQITTLSQLNTKLLEEVKSKETEVQTYKHKEIEAQKQRFDSILNQVTQKWCEVFSISDQGQKESARQMLSTFQSEDKLAEVQVFLDHKSATQVNTPKPITRPSTELAQPTQPSLPVITKSVEQMSEEDKKKYTDMLYQKMVALHK